jgi:hypothetical protein
VARRDSISLPQVLLVVLVVVGVLTVVVAGSTSSQPFGTFNAAWDGSSGVRAAASDAGGNVDVLTETTPYAEAGADATAIVLAPTERYSSADAERLRGFLDRGGTIVVAEDVGDGGNRLLARLGADVRFDGRIVVDQRHHGPTVEMPLATNVSASSYTTDVDSVMLNRGTVLTNTADATVFVHTSAFAFLDADGDRTLDRNESLGTYPVAAAESVGGGTVVAVSDPSVFINAMQDRASNAAFVRALADTEEVLIDHSHTGAQPPVRVALLWLRRTPGALAVVGVVGLTVVHWVGQSGVFDRESSDDGVE